MRVHLYLSAIRIDTDPFTTMGNVIRLLPSSLHLPATFFLLLLGSARATTEALRSVRRVAMHPKKTKTYPSDLARHVDLNAQLLGKRPYQAWVLLEHPSYDCKIQSFFK